jgi:hypothetical protein
MNPFLLVLAFTLAVFATLFCVLWRKAAADAAWWRGLFADKAESLAKRMKERDAAEMAVHERNVELTAITKQRDWLHERVKAFAAAAAKLCEPLSEKAADA